MREVRRVPPSASSARCTSPRAPTPRRSSRHRRSCRRAPPRRSRARRGGEIRATPTREQRESADGDDASDGRARATRERAREAIAAHQTLRLALDRRASLARAMRRGDRARASTSAMTFRPPRSAARAVAWTAIALVTSSASGVGPTMVLASDFHATDAALAVPFERRSEREVKMRLIAAETQHAPTTAVGQRLRGPDRAGRALEVLESLEGRARLCCGRCEDGRRVDAGEDGFRYCANGYRVGERGDAVGRDEIRGGARVATGERGPSRRRWEGSGGLMDSIASHRRGVPGSVARRGVRLLLRERDEDAVARFFSLRRTLGVGALAENLDPGGKGTACTRGPVV